MWTLEDGMRSVRDILTNDFGLGADLVGWKLWGVRGLSADGQTIVGFGIKPAGNSEGWVVTIPEPASLSLLAFGGLLLLRRKA